MVTLFVFQLQKDPESKEVEVKRYDKGGYFGGNHKIVVLLILLILDEYGIN